jgi:hypothetical protein
MDQMAQGCVLLHTVLRNFVDTYGAFAKVSTDEYELAVDETRSSVLGLYNPFSSSLPSSSNYHELCISLGYWSVPELLKSLVAKCPKDGYITLLLPEAAGREWVEGTKGWTNHGEFNVSMHAFL